MHGLTEEDSRVLIHDLREENRSLLAANRALREDIAAGDAAERARIRREMLTWANGMDREPAARITEGALRAALDRICPEEG